MQERGRVITWAKLWKRRVRVRSEWSGGINHSDGRGDTIREEEGGAKQR